MQIINVFAPGHYDYMDSYGLIACRLLRHLTALGVHVNALGLGLREVAGQPADIAKLATQPIRPAFGGIMLGYPTTYEKHGWMAQRGPRIALTMFESTKLPAEWAPILNTMDAVIVPSTFCADTFSAAGVTAPIRIVPLGVSEAYQPQPRTGDRPLTFLTFGDRGLRKGGLAAMNAFIAVFGDDMNYRLVIKAREPKGDRPRINILNQNIDMIQQDMTEAELYQLYLSCDCLINPNQGEGFGLLPREFAATGGISLATGWGGTADDIEQWGIPIPYSMVKADWAGVKRWEGHDLGEWAQPDEAALTEQLRYIAAHRQDTADRAMRRARWVHEFYDWDLFARQVLAIWQGVTNGAFRGHTNASRQAA